jgi:hypothetical protein
MDFVDAKGFGLQRIVFHCMLRGLRLPTFTYTPARFGTGVATWTTTLFDHVHNEELVKYGAELLPRGLTGPGVDVEAFCCLHLMYFNGKEFNLLLKRCGTVMKDEFNKILEADEGSEDEEKKRDKKVVVLDATGNLNILRKGLDMSQVSPFSQTSQERTSLP